MEILNNIILIGIFFTSIINTIVELDESRNFKYVLITKLLFLTMAIGAILSVVKSNQIGLTILNLAVLVALIIRIIRGLKRLKNR